MMFGDQQTIDPIFGQIATASRSDTTVGVMELEATSAGRALVVIVDDRTAHGDNTDSIGPLVTELLNEAGFLVDATVAVAADEVEIRNASQHRSHRWRRPRHLGRRYRGIPA